ncbi:hypothetical protein GGX14DRAFT_384820 [Mycena pura]|uniref:AMP-dependent synthetase/ligase domain-containing protein n=1 Tax=Mycena pura TaxID=153505 RepID=A0AAD7E4C3_9AGAR|nr:hypothetical protein GGX14DRAFT_384820 [Mycena pura]
MAHLPPAPCAQGVNSKTFTPPPHSLTVPEICDWHYKHSPLHPLYKHVDEASDEVTTVFWRTAVQGIYHISDFVIQSVQASKVSETRPTIGLCSTSGYSVFLMSPFASPAALKHLVKISGVPMILTNTEDLNLHSKLTSAVADVRRSNPSVQTVITSQLSWSQLFSGQIGPEDGPGPMVAQYDLESSWYGEIDICGEIMSAASVPMAGAAGTMLALFPASSGLILSGLKPQSPPNRPNPANVWKAIITTKSTYAFILQPFIYMFSEDLEKRKILAQLKGVVFGGGPLRKPVGDLLAHEGANLLNFYGSSESGLMCNVFTDNHGEDWEFFSFYSLVNAELIPQENSDLFEVVIKTGPFHKPTQTNTVHDDVPAFASKDLLLPHPEKPGFWKFVCRIDDQITISLGMKGIKINAVAFEVILASDPLIRGAVIFSNWPTFGVIIDPAPEYVATSDLSHPQEAAKLKSLIWPTIERFNEVVPDVAKLKKEIILFSTVDKPIVYGEKGLPRRKETIDTYVAEIEATVGPWSR